MGAPGDASGPLAGVRVCDLTRILAAPTATQLLGDLGADVIKVERPGRGDDTRGWGPPYLRDEAGRDTGDSAYYLSCNRNKRSVTVDIAAPAGQDVVRRLVGTCDILVENFKPGDLARYGLAYGDLKDAHPGLVYCSITGFGQDGPYAARPGYDLLVQAMGGIMSVTGAPDGEPMKVGVPVADVICGLYAAIAILAGLRHRERTGEGQHIDLALLDTQVAWLVNEGLNYLVSGEVPRRLGNQHPNIVPYAVLPAADGHVVIAAGNDRQFQKLCEFAGAPELADNPRFRTNADRVRNREALYQRLRAVVRGRTRAEWVDGLTARGVACGPVNSIDQVFADPQVRARRMKLSMPYGGAQAGRVDLIANPIRLSQTPVSYRHAPPHLGEHTDEVLGQVLGMDANEIASLRRDGAI